MAIICFEGLPGSGKTTAMMRRALKRFRSEACQVYSDIGTLRFPEAVFVDPERAEQLATISQGLFLFDEAQVVVDSRMWQKVPAEVLSSWSQSRKNGIDVLYTTQLFESVDSRLRGMTAEVWKCRKMGAVFLMNRVVPGTKKTISRRPALANEGVWKMYDSWEIIGKRVGHGAGRSDALEEVRRRRAERAPAAKPSERHPFHVNAIRIPGCGFSNEARSVLAWLRESGRLRPGQAGMQEAIEAELARRRWLKYCGLRWDDVPATCSYESPWLLGWSPTSVRARQNIAAARDEWEANALAAQGRAAAKRSQVKERVTGALVAAAS